MVEKRQLILDAALEVIGGEGLGGFTQPQVAKRAGLRQSHLTYYFPTRDDLLLAVADEAVRRRIEALGTAVSAPTRTAKVAALVGVLADPAQTRVLLALTQAGASREDSYRLVQRNAMKVWESDGALSLLELLKADPEVAALLSPSELEERFDLAYHYRQVDAIFERVFGG